MAQLSDKMKERMKAQAHAVSQGMAGGGRTAPRYDLTGRNAAVAAGSSIIGRPLPRWDIAQKFRQENGQWVVNEAYEDDLVFFIGLEHWWDGADGKPNREWCPKTMDEATPCPLCEAAHDLEQSADPDDRKAGKRLTARKAFLFNWIMGKTGKRQLNENGKPDIRVISLNNVLFVAISNMMTGAGEGEDAAAFARGDITDPRDGYDVMLIRPGKEGERWAAQPAPQPSPLYTQAEAPAWADWMNQLHDLPAVVEREIKPYDALYETYFGRKPDTGESAEDGFTPAPPTTPSGPVHAPAGAGVAPPDPWAAAGAPAAPPASPGPAGFEPPSTGRAATPPRRPSERKR